MARNLRLRAGVLLASSFALGILVMGAQPAAATNTLVVDDDGLASAADCNALTPAFPTIQDAVDAATSGDTIMVCPGTYPEPTTGLSPLTINESVTLVGAQVGVDARTRAGPESIITDPQGTSVAANNVVIDGFTVQDSISPAFTGFGIWLNPPTSGTRILNNIIQNNIVGIGLGGSNVAIRFNLIQNNNVPGPAQGQGIYTDQFVGGATVSNVRVEENTFSGHTVAGIDVSNTDPAGGVFNLDVDTNLFDMNGRALLLFNTHNSTIHDNDITNSTEAASAAIRLLDNNTNLTILNNDLMTGAGHAIRLTNLGLVGGPSSGLEIHQNNIEVFALTGLTVDPLSHVGTVDAECNWWNSPSGPLAADNLGGTGEEVVGDADYRPWLIARAPGGPCIGGEPSTPGKVTGGGQVQGDPLFSPLGELISLPALVPNLSGGGGQSSFGFVARCCPESGNLSYHDHGEDVRIKALTVDSLVISSPGETCPTTPGSKRAVFQGEARVTRSTGTTEEDYFVDVDDCGEPGNNDAFGLETETHSQPKSKLIGGNIQIHKPA